MTKEGREEAKTAPARAPREGVNSEEERNFPKEKPVGAHDRHISTKGQILPRHQLLAGTQNV